MEHSDVINFLADKLGMRDVERRFSTDKAGLLDDIVVQYQRVLPFHNMFLMALPKNERKIPTMAQNIERVLTGAGGLCWTLNSVMCLILNSLGYEAHCTLCTVIVVGPTEPNHSVVIVKNLRAAGDVHLVEVGIGVPTLQAVPLDFDSESPVYKNCYFTYKFVKKDNQIFRVHKISPTSPTRYHYTDGEWGQFCHFKPDILSLDVISETLNENVYSNLSDIFNQWLRVTRMSPDLKHRSLKNNILLVEVENRKTRADQIDDEKMAITLHELLPHVPKDTIRRAVTDWITAKVAPSP